jgi:hypothetical protein
MGRGNRKSDRHGARIGAAFHGTPDQISSYVGTFKCHNSQVSGMRSRDKRDSFGPNGTTWITLC